MAGKNRRLVAKDTRKPVKDKRMLVNLVVPDDIYKIDAFAYENTPPEKLLREKEEWFYNDGTIKDENATRTIIYYIAAKR